MSIRLKLDMNRGDFHLNWDLELPDSQTTVIFGPSGSGKTTALRAIAGIDRHPNTHVSVGDRVWQNSTHFEPPFSRRVGYVTQADSIFDHLSVRENVEYGYRRRNQETEWTPDFIIRQMELEPLLERPASKLSGGERQRVAIARALASQPSLLLMDEPLTSLDQHRKDTILSILQPLVRKAKCPMIYVSHDIEEVIQLADTIVCVAEGQIQAHGDAHEILTRNDLALSGLPGAGVHLDGSVIAIDSNYQLATISTAAGNIILPANSLNIHKIVRLQISARDVSIAQDNRNKSTIINRLPAIVQAIDEGHDGGVLNVQLRCQNTVLLARITRKSVDELNLSIGQSVIAQIKSVAVK